MKAAIIAFGMYVLTAIALTATVLSAAPVAKKSPDAPLFALLWTFFNILTALLIVATIQQGKEDDAIMAATIFSFVYILFIVIVLHELGKLQWLYALISSVASQLASAAVAFIASAGAPISSGALALSLAYFAAKTLRRDYIGMARALFFAFTSALVLLSLTLL